jgi:hypothetical protein
LPNPCPDAERGDRQGWQQIPGVPAFSIFGELAYAFWGFDAAISVYEQDKVYVNDRNTETAGEYWLVNVRGGFTQTMNGFTLSEFICVDNVLDRYYIAAVNANDADGALLRARRWDQRSDRCHRELCFLSVAASTIEGDRFAQTPRPMRIAGVLRVFERSARFRYRTAKAQESPGTSTSRVKFGVLGRPGDIRIESAGRWRCIRGSRDWRHGLTGRVRPYRCHGSP